MKVVYKNIEVTVDDNASVYEAFIDELKDNFDVLACKVNNEVKSLNTILKENDEIEFIYKKDRDGARIYNRGVLFIMAKAFKELYPEELLTINYQLSNSMLCELYKKTPTEEMIENVKKKMQEIIDNNLPIVKKVMSKEEALKFIEKENTIVGKMQFENTNKKEFSLYFCEDYYNYFFGVMPISTKYIDLFDLKKYSDGFLISYPNRKEPNKLPEYKETKKLYKTLEEYEDIYRLLGLYTLDKLNEAIRNGKAKDIILISEALHEKRIAQIADQIASNKDKRVVLIAGPSSSGKTTFAKRLGIQLRLNGLKPKTISVDDYFVEREQTPKDEEGNNDYESLYAVDLKLLNDHLVKLLNGEEIELPKFNFKTGHKEYLGEKMTLADDEVLVMEGIHCLNDELTPAIDKSCKFKIYISALTVLNIDYYNRISTTDTRTIRRTVRDSQFRGYNAEHTLAVWPSVSAGEEKNIFPYQEEADAMFNSSLIYEINALKSYALPLYEQITKDSPVYSEAKRLCEFLRYFEDIPLDIIPKNSLLQEFLGTGIFDY